MSRAPFTVEPNKIMSYLSEIKEIFFASSKLEYVLAVEIIRFLSTSFHDEITFSLELWL